MLLAIILAFLQILSIGDTNPLEESENQAEYYINNIETNQHLEESLWALAVLGSEHSEIKKFIEEKIRTGNYSSKSLNKFRTFEDSYESQLRKVVFETGSFNLLLALLLEIKEKREKKKVHQKFISKFKPPSVDNVNYQSLFVAVIENNVISEEMLSNKSFLLPHFFLLYEGGDLIPESYLKEIEKKWLTNSPKDLPTAIAEASLLRASYLLYNYAKIASFYDSLIENELIPNSYLKFRVYQYLNYSVYRLGYYDRSLNILREFTLPLSKYLDQKTRFLETKQFSGVCLYNIGKVKAAEKVYKEVLKEVNKNKPEIRLSSIYNNLALTYHKLGKYDEYLDLQFQALEIAKRDTNYDHQIKIYNNLFIYYRRNNDRKNALFYLEKSQELASENEKLEDLGNIYTSLGTMYRQFDKNFKKAFKNFDRADSVLHTKNDIRQFVHLLNERAQTYEEQRKYAKALAEYSRIINIIPEENEIDRIDAIINKAIINLEIGNTENADQLIRELKSYDLAQLDFEQIVKAKTVEARYLQKIGESQKALDILIPSLEQVVVRAKSSADLQSGFWHVKDEYLNAFELAVSTYIKNEQPYKAVKILDHLKTINNASLYQNPLVKSSLLNESELTQYKRLTNQLDANRKELLTAPESQRFEIQQTINQLNLKKRTLDKKLTTEMDSDPISIREIQNKISGRELVMHITELNEQYYIANITRSDVSMKVLPFDSTKKKLFSDAVKQVSTHKTDLDSLYAITNFLEIKEIPDHINKITIIPDSYLYQLPIDILPLEVPTHSYSYGEVRYLIEKFNTRYLTSLNDFKPNANEPANSRYEQNFAGYGISNFGEYGKKKLVPLPFAQTEVTTIAERLTQLPNKRTYINNASTKNTFTQTAPRSGILHLATHSEVSERDPLFSTIYMSKTTDNIDSTFHDQIFAYELFELNLNNEMIMLNSCESGSGSYIQGTGVMGISRALHYAGANSLILNLWSVNDMLASDFAIYFYDQLNKGKSKSEALRSTKQHFLRTKNASPHFWGPYMLIGNTEPVVHPNRTINLAVAGTFIFYFLLMIGLSYLKGRGKSTTQTVQHKEVA